MNEPATEYIVSEISKNWRGEANNQLLSQKFEEVIEHNLNRGYVLYSFQLDRLMVTPNEMNETIIAVFRRPLPLPIILAVNSEEP